MSLGGRSQVSPLALVWTSATAMYMYRVNCEGWLSPGGHSSGGRALTA